MAINVVIPLLIPLEENLHNATRLLSSATSGPMEFSEQRYCVVLSEDARLNHRVTTIYATHKNGKEVLYSITGGNKDGLFTIDQHSGAITLAASLDYELHHKHQLVVVAEAGMDAAHAIVQVRVLDVNDNPPSFLKPHPQVLVVEEDDRHLPAVILQVEATDADARDAGWLEYSLRGDGVDDYQPEDAFFSIDPLTGHLFQLRAIDRDPPHGRGVWRIQVTVRDGQGFKQPADSFHTLVTVPDRQAATENSREPARKHHRQQAPLSSTGHPSRTWVYRHGYSAGKEKQLLREVTQNVQKSVFFRSLANFHSKRDLRVQNKEKETEEVQVESQTNVEYKEKKKTKRELHDILLTENYVNTQLLHNVPRNLTTNGGGCVEMGGFGGNLAGDALADVGSGTSGIVGSAWVHVVETTVTVLVKDINDNAPVFPNTTMLGEVLENAPTGVSVLMISAWDADDDTEGTNARLSYSIEKNVIDERSGEALFSMEPHTGLVMTALCCLDRETTPEYQIQVVASDGGGLKGTGTVVVRVGDVNDNAPRLSRRDWLLEMDETPGSSPPSHTTLLELAATDPDILNHFAFRVAANSGWGWQHFGIRTVGAVGHLYARHTLDYETEEHRRGFRFMVQVSDKGPADWSDLSHVDSAWVKITLRNLNDNPPTFSRPHAHVTVREDLAPGTLLTTLPAHDPDVGGELGVDYHLEGGWDVLSVDVNGTVTLRGMLDRDAPGGDAEVARILAVDRGRPRLTATATLTITVTDVNDCPPSLLPPTRLHITEGSPPTKLGVLKITDPDVWALGHGPPFNISMSPSNPAHVLNLVSLKFDRREYIR